MSVLGAAGADGHCGGSRMSRGTPRVKSGGRAGDKHGEDSAGRLQGSSGTVDTSQGGAQRTLRGGGTGGRPLALASSEFRKRRTTNSAFLASLPLIHQTWLTAKVLTLDAFLPAHVTSLCERYLPPVVNNKTQSYIHTHTHTMYSAQVRSKGRMQPNYLLAIDSLSSLAYFPVSHTLLVASN